MVARTKLPKTAPLAATREVLGVHVKFTLNTPDGLRRVIFELKTLDGDKVNWTIVFQLFQRAKKTDPFGDALVDLLVEVDAALNDKADKTSQNMTRAQQRHALGPAADTAKDAKEGNATEEEAKESVQDTLNH